MGGEKIVPMLNITKAFLKSLIKSGELKKVSTMTYELLFEHYFFCCQKKTHEVFKYIKCSHRMAERMKPKTNKIRQ